MKQIVSLISAVLILVSTKAQSLCITTDKTTSLIFPYAIKHVDRGTKEVLVEPVKEADNILLIKAASRYFDETNLTVITSDGSVYSFDVSYYTTPLISVYKFPIQNKTAIATYCNSIIDNPKTMTGIKDASWNMIARVDGIYIKDNAIYYQLDLINQSPIDYDVNFLRFYIRDKKKSKRTASQENELMPLHIAGNTSLVKANDHNSIVVALDKFTIPDAKYLAIEIGEKNGGRNLLLKLNNRKIIKAIPFPDLK
jgi:hypothetical protein